MEYWEGSGKRMPSVITNEFRGLNRLSKGREGELSACLNMSSSEYPCLAVSKGYEKVEVPFGRVMALHSLENGFTGVCETDEGVYVFYKGQKQAYSTGGKKIGSDSEIFIHCLNNVLFIQETTAFGNSVLYKFMPEADKKEDRIVKQCYILNNDFEAMFYNNWSDISYGSNPFGSRPAAVLAIKKEKDKGFIPFKQIPEDGKVYEMIETASKYIIMGPDGEEDKFSIYREKKWEYDKWKEENENNFPPVYMMFSGDTVSTVDGEVTIPFPSGAVTYQDKERAEDMYLVTFCDESQCNFEASLLESDDKNWHEVAVITERVMPKVTPMEVYKGRLWCARVDGTSVLASAFNDTGEDFFYFSGTAASSVYINSSLPGNFVGVKAYNDSIIAFKENSMTVIYGDTAADFSVGKEISGVGCIDIRSAQVVCGVLYFCSPSGFYAYAGGQPRRISEKLKVKFKKVCAFSADGKYYAEGTKEDGTTELLVYDTEKGIWLSEESRGLSGACGDNGEIYVVASGEVLRKKKDIEDSEPCVWYFESMEICEGVFEKKGIAEIYIKGKLAEGAWMTVQVTVDGKVLNSKTFYGNGKIKVYRAPVKLKKDDSYKIKVLGSGEAVIYEMERKVSVGGRNIKNAEV